MEILTSKLHSIELNIINSKIQCLNREISLILRRFYNHQINKSQKVLRKINFNLNINLSLIRLSRHINNNSSTHLHYLHKNINMSLRILKNKVYTGFTSNLIFKLNTLQRVVYYKKDVMYTKIRGTVVYREKKERLKRKIEVILKKLGEKMMKESEKYMKSKIGNCIQCNDDDIQSDHRDASYLSNDSINEGYCTVNVYDSSSIDLEIGEAICTVNTISDLHGFKEGSCEVEKYANINREVWNTQICSVTKKDEEVKDQTVQVSKDENTRDHDYKVLNHYGFTGNEPNPYLKLRDEINFKDEVVEENGKDEINFKDRIVEENQSNEEIDFKDRMIENNAEDKFDFKDEVVEKNQSKEEIDFRNEIVQENQSNNEIDFKGGIVEKNQSKDNVEFKDKIVQESKSKDDEKIENISVHNLNQVFDSKICTVNTHAVNFVDKSNYSQLSFYQSSITSSLARLNKNIVRKLYISLQDMYIDIIKLKILLTLKQFQYLVNNQKYSSDTNNNSKLTYILERGNLESDRRFLEMINETLQDIEKYRDPIVIRMGIQFILAKRYVEDIIYLKQ